MTNAVGNDAFRIDHIGIKVYRVFASYVLKYKEGGEASTVVMQQELLNAHLRALALKGLWHYTENITGEDTWPYFI